MPRQLRIQYPGAIYHVMNRGDRREDIFKDDADRERFLLALTEACRKTDWQIHAYCLMRNHFHLVAETPSPNLVEGMKWLLGVYTKRFNIRHKLCGHLFAGRYKALFVDGSGNGYLKTVCDYVHLNPVRAKITSAKTPLEAFKWSSYPEYLKQPKDRPLWLRVDRLFGEHGIARDSRAGRKQFAMRMEIRRAQEEEADYAALRRGWCLGSEEFRAELLEAAGKSAGPSHYGSARRESGEQKAKRIVSDGLKKAGLEAKVLKTLPKSDAKKVALARQVRKETTMSLKWIAENLHMGSWTYVSNLLNSKQK